MSLVEDLAQELADAKKQKAAQEASWDQLAKLIGEAREYSGIVKGLHLALQLLPGPPKVLLPAEQGLAGKLEQARFKISMQKRDFEEQAQQGLRKIKKLGAGNNGEAEE